MNKIRIAILGASGYTGAELIRLLLTHPHADIRALTGETAAGKKLGEVFPHLAHTGLPDLVTVQGVDFSGIDLVFCCLPHGTTQEVIAALPSHIRIVDLSADFRLTDPASYAEWYGHEHRAAALQEDAVYGLSELARDAVGKARLVANPGCYPTSAQLPLIPLLKAGLVKHDGIIIDAKSGVTGAGRAAKQAMLFCEVSDGIGAYGVGKHRHTPEIEQGLSQAAGSAVQVSFTPHLVPMGRGILSTIYAALTPGKTLADARACLERTYANEPFTRLAAPGLAPTTHMVRGSNLCLMNLFADRRAGHIVITSVIDNLCKGASGQAVQNFNIMYGLPETLGLPQTALFP